MGRKNEETSEFWPILGGFRQYRNPDPGSFGKTNAPLLFTGSVNSWQWCDEIS
jgi:hypothetical protein